MGSPWVSITYLYHLGAIERKSVELVGDTGHVNYTASFSRKKVSYIEINRMDYAQTRHVRSRKSYVRLL